MRSIGESAVMAPAIFLFLLSLLSPILTVLAAPTVIGVADGTHIFEIHSIGASKQPEPEYRVVFNTAWDPSLESQMQCRGRDLGPGSPLVILKCHKGRLLEPVKGLTVGILQQGPSETGEVGDPFKQGFKLWFDVE